MSVTCPHCGAPLAEGDKFCGACGQPVEPPAAEEEQAPAPTQPPVPSGEPPPTVTGPEASQGAGWRLIGIEGEFAGEETRLGQALTLGRDLTAEIRLANPRASRQHARILRRPEGYVVQDEGSSNGTWLNGERVQGAVPLKDGDEIRIEDSVWRVAAPGGRGDRDPAAPRPQQDPVRPSQPVAGTETGGNRRSWLLVGLVILLVVTCLCCLLSGAGEDLIYELGL